MPKKDNTLGEAFDEIEAYAERLDGLPERPDHKVVADGLLLIARVIASGFRALVLLRS